MGELERSESLKKAQESIRSIEKKHDAIIKGKKILVLNGKDPKFPKANDIGIKTWGKIDGLVKYHFYYFHFVDNFKS